MDVDTTTIERYMELLKNQRLVLRKAKARQGQRPHDRKSRAVAEGEFMLSLMMQGFRVRPDDKNMMHSSFTPPAYLPCIAPIADLKPISIQDLQLEIHHRGTYLLLRSITPPSRMTAIMALMEDEIGDVVLLQLYQQEDEETRKARDVVNVGTIFLVKEPYFKVMADGEYGLRVDHVSDVITLSVDDTRIPQKWRPRLLEIGETAEALKIKGNEAIGEGRYRDAIQA
jgi:hypothetical protein